VPPSDIIEHGPTGFLCADEEDKATRTGHAIDLDRAACRASVEARSSTERMVKEHLALYRRLVRARRTLTQPVLLVTAGHDQWRRLDGQERVAHADRQHAVERSSATEPGRVGEVGHASSTSTAVTGSGFDRSDPVQGRRAVGVLRSSMWLDRDF
jgi:hypothetical protein